MGNHTRMRTLLVLALMLAVAHVHCVESEDAVEEFEEPEMVIPVDNEHFLDYVTALIDEYAPGNDPAAEGSDPAFGGALAKAKRDADKIEAQAEKDAHDAQEAKDAVASAKKEENSGDSAKASNDVSGD